VDVRDENRPDVLECGGVDASSAAQVEDPAAQHGIGDNEQAVQPDRGAAVPEPCDALQRELSRRSESTASFDIESVTRSVSMLSTASTGIASGRVPKWWPVCNTT